MRNMLLLLGLVCLVGSGCAEKIPPTAAGVAYGPDPAQHLDLWLAPGERTPLVVSIHGGGWFEGSRTDSWRGPSPFLKHGISVARIDYRLTPRHPLPAPILDAARAVQFLRAHADEWHLDPKRVAAMGWSAGGTTALWLALHDDLADPGSSDPVLRQSSRVCGAVAIDAPTTIEPGVIEKWFGPEVPWHQMIPAAVGAGDMGEVWPRLAELAPIYREYSPIRLLDRGDPPVYLRYSRAPTLPPGDADAAIHHPLFGLRFKARADAIGVPCTLLIGPRRRTNANPAFRYLMERFGLADPSRPR